MNYLIEGNRAKILNDAGFINEDIPELLNGLISPDFEKKQNVYRTIRLLAESKDIYLSSIYEFYKEKGKGKYLDITVPAMNLRVMSYEMARAVFSSAIENGVGAFIFEIARTEIGYTDQMPIEYVGSVLLAALKEGYKGYIFIQGDHFQVNRKKFFASEEEKNKEINTLKELIHTAIEAGFYQIDIDASTLVIIEKQTVAEQQYLNSKYTAEFTNLIRNIEPITVSTGGEIGEIGGKNSTVEELRAYLDEFNKFMPEGKIGISKVSIQTGTTHGGVVLPDGNIARVKIDFDTLKTLSKVAREEYGLAGAVQHGASTLPKEVFDKFPEAGTAEIHLATEFQNIIMDHDALPSELKEEIVSVVKNNFKNQWKEGMSEQQFIYKNRKRAAGILKHKFYALDESIKKELRASLKERFTFLFKQLNVVNTKNIINMNITKKYTIIDR